MKKLFFGILFLALVTVVPIPMMARADVNVSIALPPSIVFAAPPMLIVLPETYVYVVPDADVDIFFYNGWWWRPWEGRWYRSRYYNSGWGYYRSVPSFYRVIPSGWRNDYREHRWGGHQWNYQRIPHEQVQRNWKGWETSKHWEKQNTWGVQGLKPRTRSRQLSPAVQPKSQAKPQPREVKSQRSEQQPREVKTKQAQLQSSEVKQQRSQQKPRDVQPKNVQPQHREAPQQSKPQQGKPERGEEEKQDRK